VDLKNHASRARGVLALLFVTMLLQACGGIESKVDQSAPGQSPSSEARSGNAPSTNDGSSEANEEGSLRDDYTSIFQVGGDTCIGAGVLWTRTRVFNEGVLQARLKLKCTSGMSDLGIEWLGLLDDNGTIHSPWALDQSPLFVGECNNGGTCVDPESYPVGDYELRSEQSHPPEVFQTLGGPPQTPISRPVDFDVMHVRLRPGTTRPDETTATSIGYVRFCQGLENPDSNNTYTCAITAGPKKVWIETLYLHTEWINTRTNRVKPLRFHHLWFKKRDQPGADVTLCAAPGANCQYRVSRYRHVKL